MILYLDSEPNILRLLMFSYLVFAFFQTRKVFLPPVSKYVDDDLRLQHSAKGVTFVFVHDVCNFSPVPSGYLRILGMGLNEVS